MIDNLKHIMYYIWIICDSIRPHASALICYDLENWNWFLNNA